MDPDGCPTLTLQFNTLFIVNLESGPGVQKKLLRTSHFKRPVDFKPRLRRKYCTFTKDKEMKKQKMPACTGIYQSLSMVTLNNLNLK